MPSTDVTKQEAQVTEQAGVPEVPPSQEPESAEGQTGTRTRDTMLLAKERAMDLERRVEEVVKTTTKKLVHVIHERPGASAAVAGGAAFALAATVGAAEVAVAAACAYAAYRWLRPEEQMSEPTKPARAARK